MTLTCEFCGRTFVSHDNKRRYCSCECAHCSHRVNAWREDFAHQERERRLAERDAAYAKAFPGLGPREVKMSAALFRGQNFTELLQKFY